MTNSPETSGSKLSEGLVGVILQRGGEELRLGKVGDRFTVVLEAEVPADWKEQLPAQWEQRVPRAELEEFLVPANRLNEVMQQARAQSWVRFVSHVYHLQADRQSRLYLTDEVVVQFAPEANAEACDRLVSSLGLEAVKPLEGVPKTFVLRVTRQARENPIKLANRLLASSLVLLAEPNIVLHTQQLYRPSDTRYPGQWYLHHNGGSNLKEGSHMFLEQAWDVTRGDRSIVVAITDDSVDLNHPDFQGAGKLVAPRDLKEKDFLPMPVQQQDNHGTGCAGVAVAEENGIGVVGVAPGCSLMPIRTTGYLDDESIEQLFDWAIANGADVISCSWGASTVHFPLSLRQSAAISRAATKGRNGKGCVVLFAAGNANRPINDTVNERGWKGDMLKGSVKWLNGLAVHPDVIAVAASTSLGKKAAYSNWGRGISVCAPSNNAPPGMWFRSTGYIQTAPSVQSYLSGLGVLTTDRLGQEGYDAGDYTNTFGGTSSACPMVAGVAALVLSVNPNLTAREVKQILQETADKMVDSDADPQLGNRYGTYDSNGYSLWFGYGKVNAFKAVQKAKANIRTIQVTQQIVGRSDRTLAIPDAGAAPSGLSLRNLLGGSSDDGIKSEIYLSSSGEVKNVQVGVDIEHGFLGDLEIFLTSPTGTTVLLQDRSLGSQMRLQTIYTLQATPLLKQFLGEPVRGNWSLQVCDRAPGDTGVLNEWTISLGV